MKIPDISHDKVIACCNLLILAMLGTNADIMETKLDGFHDNDGKVYGDFKITVQKIK
jgi:hypothetical protein